MPTPAARRFASAQPRRCRKCTTFFSQSAPCAVSHVERKLSIVQLVEKLGRFDQWGTTIRFAEEHPDETLIKILNIPQEVTLLLGREDERASWRRGSVMQGAGHHEIRDALVDRFCPHPDLIPVGGIPAIDWPSPLYCPSAPVEKAKSVRSRNSPQRNAAV